MDIKSFWKPAIVPAHSTSSEKLVQADDSISISEMFERAAKGESLGGAYDEYESDSFFDMSHDPEMQDPLLREAMQLETLNEIREVKGTKSRSTRGKKKEDDSSSVPTPDKPGDTTSQSPSLS